MAKSFRVGPQIISQSKFSSLRPKQKPTLTIQNLRMYMKMRRKKSLLLVSKSEVLCIRRQLSQAELRKLRKP